jgi:CRISPR-associated protein Cas2
MSMTVVVTRNVAARYRGFLASVMLEIAPGVYTGPRMTKGVRDRIWTVLSDWFVASSTVGLRAEDRASIVMTWRDQEAEGGQRVLTLGIPAKTLVEADGLLLVKSVAD